MDKSLDMVTKGCHQCASLAKAPKMRDEQSSEDPPETVGLAFAADVMKRERQLVLVVRECVTSFTFTKLLESERHHDLRDAIIQLLAEVHPLDGPYAVIRTDPAPGFKALVDDQLLTRHHISIELGRAKNLNKNPVAEKAIQELEGEILRANSSPHQILTPMNLAIVTARLNTRIRKRGLSSREMWMQRDQFSNRQIPVEDQKLISSQQIQRSTNHVQSEKAKCPSNQTPVTPDLKVGDIVYLRKDLNKTNARERYIVVTLEFPWCNIRKFIGNQLRNNSYRVKCSDCFKVTTHFKASTKESPIEFDSDEESERNKQEMLHVPPATPDIPLEISIPPPKPIISSNDYDPELVTYDSQEGNIDNGSDSETNTDVPHFAESNVSSRPSRKRCLPKKLNDYVLY